jgi:hypothetical protein
MGVWVVGCLVFGCAADDGGCEGCVVGAILGDWGIEECHLQYEKG